MADLLKDISGGNIALAVVLALFWWRFEQSQRSGKEQKDELKADVSNLRDEVEKHTTELKSEITDVRRSGHVIYQKLIEDNRVAMERVTAMMTVSMKEVTEQITRSFERIIDRFTER